VDLRRRVLLAVASLAVVACTGPSAADDGSEAEPASEARDVRGMAPAAAGTVPSVVTARPVGGEPGGGATAPGEEAGTAIDQFGLQFSPTLAFVTLGAPLTFTNSEGSLSHNVNVRRVADDTSVLDEDASVGDEILVTLGAEGGYDVLCAMHPGMSAFVFVSADPYRTFADPDGSFTLGDLPAGEYEVRLWTLDGGFHEPVTVSVAETGAEVDLRPSD
jgi:plastocyanin